MGRTRLFFPVLWLGLAACTPVLNWRDVGLDNGELKALLPCKPDTATRAQQLAGQAVSLAMAGCEAGGALFVVASVEAGPTADMTAVQQQWQAQMLGNMQGRVAQRAARAIRGASETPPAPWIKAEGVRADGHAVQAQAVWFARGRRLYHAALYADRVTPEMAEPFFSGIELR